MIALLLRFLRWLFGAPQARRTFNLLTTEILAEVTLHLMSDDKRKAIISKLDDDQHRELRQKVVQALIFTAIDVAKERAVGINWAALNQLYPWQGPALAPPAPPPVPPG